MFEGFWVSGFGGSGFGVLGLQGVGVLQGFGFGVLRFRVRSFRGVGFTA